MKKSTLRFNEALNIEILDLYYFENLNAHKIWSKIKHKICENSIYAIISEHKLYKSYKGWFMGFT